MSRYFANIYDTVNTLWTGMRITWRHMINIKRDNVTLQYPEERWPRPERNIGFVPSYIMIKANAASRGWVIVDVARAGGSATTWNYHLTADSTNAEDTNAVYDIRTYDSGGNKGFEIGTNVATGNLNSSGVVYTYCAFA